MRTSYAAGSAQVSWRDGYRVIRKAGRYLVFPRAAFSEMMGWHGASDALVEIWNGMPFFSPVWAAKRPRAVWLHHVHDSMWEMTLPPRLARLGRTMEFRIAPPLYRNSRIVTLSESSKDEISRRLHLRPSNITVVPPGIDPDLEPGGRDRRRRRSWSRSGGWFRSNASTCSSTRWSTSSSAGPQLHAVIVGEGYERDALERRIAEVGAGDWISLPGRVDHATLLDLYRRAWVVASASRHEGWGMTITEAAACRTPAVATRIAGHSDAIVDGTTGLLVDDDKDFAIAIDRVLGDGAFRSLLAKNALEHASQFTWAATARGTLEVLATEALRRKSA